MSYTYDLSPAACFEDRYSQFIAFGIPKADVDTLRATIKICGPMRRADGRTNGPHSRGNIWKRETRSFASFAYGFAKFPCLANDARRTAQQHQLETYLKAAPNFPVNSSAECSPFHIKAAA
jgi:esterase FrsA